MWEHLASSPYWRYCSEQESGSFLIEDAFIDIDGFALSALDELDGGLISYSCDDGLGVKVWELIEDTYRLMIKGTREKFTK